MRRKGSIAYEVTVFGNFAHTFTAQEVRLRLRSCLGRANLFCIDVINAAIGNIEAHTAVDPHMAFQFHFVCVRIVLRVIGVDIRVTHVNGDVVSRRRQTVFVIGLPSRRDFNRSILQSLDFSRDEAGARKESGEQQKQLSHGGRRRYRSEPFLQSQKRCALRHRALRAQKNWIDNHWIDNRKPAIC